MILLSQGEKVTLTIEGRAKDALDFLRSSQILMEIDMKTKVWTRPDFEEVSLGCEINCYAPAEI